MVFAQGFMAGMLFLILLMWLSIWLDKRIKKELNNTPTHIIMESLQTKLNLMRLMWSFNSDRPICQTTWKFINTSSNDIISEALVLRERSQKELGE